MFDFDATLPLMAVQFLILTLLLNAVFYKPLSKVLDERADYIQSQEKDARQRLAQTEQLTKEYKQQLAQALKKSQEVIASAQADAKKITAEKLAEAQKQAQAEKEKAQKEIQEQKEAAMASLEKQVDSLSNQILEKLLGKEIINS
jgi:F-type H+-transporting ATPase subunit b